jgi:hypothetical protein
MEKLIKAIDVLLEKNPAVVGKIGKYISDKMNTTKKATCPECGYEMDMPVKKGDHENMGEKDIAAEITSGDALDNLKDTENDVK